MTQLQIKNQHAVSHISEISLKLASYDLNIWNQYLKKCPLSNAMQTWPYAIAKLRRENKKPLPYFIYRHNQIIGLTFIFEIKWGPLQMIEIKRGPLLLDVGYTYYPDLNLFYTDFAKALNHQFPKRWLRFRHWLTEIDFIEDKKSTFNFSSKVTPHSALNFPSWHKSQETYSTGILDLTQSKDELLKSFTSKWRNGLNKSLKQNLIIKVETDLEKIKVFIKNHSRYQAQKNFKSYSAEFLKEELILQNSMKSFFIISAYPCDRTSEADFNHSQNAPVASLLITFHGTGATYRASYNTLLGRKSNAHYLLIWKALLELKERQLHFFDLGGFLPIEASKVDHFKLGLNPMVHHSLGFWK